ncbi:MAG: hypothetical protein IJ304_02835 [Clostridia bacterium]|nr:hypothetical protein [Clostridia bacterium]
MKNKSKVLTLIIGISIFLITLLCWTFPKQEYSESERRPLAEKPELSIGTILSGEFMEGFEKYVVDHFPKRDNFRRVKALFSEYVFNKKDNNSLYFADGHISKIEYPENIEMLDHAQERFDFLYDSYLKDKNVNVYLSIIPDKNYFLAEKNGYLSIDYDEFIESFKNRVDYMNYIDLVPLLSIDDFYRTDSHWKQENIVDIAEFVAESMGTQAKSQYTVNTLEKPFSGVYLGQSALPVEPDTIKYLTNDILDSCKVNYYDTGMAVSGDIYNMEKAMGKDPYEMFLSGTTPLVTIENEKASSEKELVVFRDSYASSLVPLLVPGYSKITVVDIRYMQSNFVGNFIDFDNQDVYFMYSTTLLNNSLAMH